MKDSFREYFSPDNDFFERLWHNGVFSFDASVLLNIYGYSSETRDDLVALIEGYADRIYLPHQFASEYAKRRPRTIIKQVKNFQDAERDFKEIEAKRFAPKTEHPYLSPRAVEAFQSIVTELEEGRRQMEAMVNSDRYADLLLKVCEGKVGTSYDELALSKVHDEARGRYVKSTPPGYMDLKDKGEPEAFGDYIGWRQLIEFARDAKKDIILVTDDVKEDWWHLEGGRTIGPRPELLAEFRKETGQDVWIYNSASFLKYAREYGSTNVKDAAIEEVNANILKLVSEFLQRDSATAKERGRYSGIPVATVSEKPEGASDDDPAERDSEAEEKE